MAYPASFWMLAVGSFVMTGLDFAAILVIFGKVDTLGGFSLPRSRSCTPAPASGSRSAT